MEEIATIFTWIEKLGIGNVLTVIFVWFFIRPFLEKHLKLIDTLTTFINEELRPVVHAHKSHVEKCENHHKDTEQCKIEISKILDYQKKSLSILQLIAQKQGMNVIE